MFNTDLQAAARRLPSVSLLLAASALWASLWPGVAEAVQYDTLAILHGEFWRIWTGHFVHWSTDHLLWDLLVFVCLGTLCERRSRSAFLGCVLLGAPLISASVAWFHPELQTYRGLSGIDSALFSLWLCQTAWQAAAQRQTARLAALLLGGAGFVGKTVYEMATDLTLFVDSSSAGMQPLVIVHLVGAVVGCTAVCATTGRSAAHGQQPIVAA